MTPTYIEFQLAWLIHHTQITQPRAERRLNGIENLIAELVKCWRAEAIVEPMREIRMASTTRVAMLEWIEREESADGTTLLRLAAYETIAVCDESVPDSWVRVLLARAD